MASTRIPADPSSSYRAIENLIAAYAELVDGGDFTGLGTLLADATFTGSGTPVSGPDAIEKMFSNTLIIYDDGTPRTKHVTTNIAIELDEEAGTAVSRAYFAVLQALPGLPLQPIVSGRYHDRFERSAGRWRFAERQVRIDLTGDVSRHLRHPRPLPGLTSAQWLLSQNGQSIRRVPAAELEPGHPTDASRCAPRPAPRVLAVRPARQAPSTGPDRRAHQDTCAPAQDVC
jgi:3-phenylpropionate/cinnamic acid dioxygenase small subunit